MKILDFRSAFTNAIPRYICPTYPFESKDSQGHSYVQCGAPLYMHILVVKITFFSENPSPGGTGGQVRSGAYLRRRRENQDLFRHRVTELITSGQPIR